MDAETKKLTLELLTAWAESRSDATAVILGGRGYSPEEYVAAVKNETPLGHAYCAFMEAAAKQANRPVDQFLKDTIRPHTHKSAGVDILKLKG